MGYIAKDVAFYLVLRPALTTVALFSSKHAIQAADFSSFAPVAGLNEKWYIVLFEVYSICADAIIMIHIGY